jgi:hypothetical protein
MDAMPFPIAYRAVIAAAHFAGSGPRSMPILGLTPQALRYRPLRGLQTLLAATQVLTR